MCVEARNSSWQQSSLLKFIAIQSSDRAAVIGGTMVEAFESSKIEEGQLPDDEELRDNVEHTKTERINEDVNGTTEHDERGRKLETLTENFNREKQRCARRRDEEPRSASDAKDRRARESSRSPVRRGSHERETKYRRVETARGARDSRHGDRRDRDGRHRSDGGRDRHIASNRDRDRRKEVEAVRGDREYARDRAERSRPAGRDRGEAPRPDKHELERPGKGAGERVHLRAVDDDRRKDSRSVHVATSTSNEPSVVGNAPPLQELAEDKPPNGAPHSTTPMSVEEVLKRKREAEEEAAKPKFLSRKDREKLALHR